MTVNTDAQEDGSIVVFRLSNRAVSGRCLGASYVTYDQFDPAVDALVELQVFEKFISTRDFRITINTINALLPKYRSRSLQASLLAILLSFAAVTLLVLVSMPGGITLQVVTLLAHTVLQSTMRSWCTKEVNITLELKLNPALQDARGLSVAINVRLEGCMNYVECDFLQRPRQGFTNPFVLHGAREVDSTLPQSPLRQPHSLKLPD